MASVMAIGSEVFGSCVEGIFASVEIEDRYAWFFCEWRYVSFIRGRKSSSRLAVEVADGARYWVSFWAV